ncbi:hypothetical protein MUGA111182_09835 [Mucilaginibacter galii]|uniref:Lipoprotein n=1 Tax=Mucilaginibacter galii TaxID=2005073 RepID=A0A917JAS4_9SPHI|nr:hypothetical protein [Mucilaginibacter galii]GGI51177.1 hypothetical protein GCM10011425_23890 [Mucilaginibacter galii]
MKMIKNTYQHIAIILSVLSLCTACQSSAKKNTGGDTTQTKGKKGKISKRTQDGCYLYTSGNKMQDTLYVQLHIQDNKVSGKMTNEIFEKDSRKGTLTGTMNTDKSINAIWAFMQEGVKDTMAVEFRLNHTSLLQKPLKADAATGRQITDHAAPYSIELKPTDCNK